MSGHGQQLLVNLLYSLSARHTEAADQEDGSRTEGGGSECTEVGAKGRWVQRAESTHVDAKADRWVQRAARKGMECTHVASCRVPSEV